MEEARKTPYLTRHLLIHVTTGQLRTHAGSLVWKAVHLPVAGGTLDDGANLAAGYGRWHENRDGGITEAPDLPFDSSGQL